MSSTILTVITFLVEEAAKLAPNFIADLLGLFAKGAPTATDFATLRAKIADESYAQFVPASALPPDNGDAATVTPPGTVTPAVTALASPAAEPLKVAAFVSD